ncbi:fad/nad(p)-binding oxidoreductase family protein [Citrus sinensis]|nr:fad/nad(p)-binding oxidoreductase family protein [Citrus sinensis]
MNNAASKVAVVGSGTRNGISVTLFDSARGPGGRMSQRRETSEDGKEMLFDHGAPFFTVTNNDVLALVCEWESGGLVAEWKVNLGSFDCVSKKFVNIQQDGMNKKYVGVPGMNSICKALCRQPGVESKFGVGVGRFEWLEDKNLWSVSGLDGQSLGQFNGAVASDKNVVSPRFRDVTGRPPPLDLTFAPDLAVKLEEIPVNPCFALMLAFSEPLSSIPVKGFSFQDSEVLSWAHCDSSKPGRSANSERWVLHSTADYARTVIAQTGLQKPSEATLKKVAEEMFQEFQGTGLSIPLPIFRKAHRWGMGFSLELTWKPKTLKWAAENPLKHQPWLRNRYMTLKFEDIQRQKFVHDGFDSGQLSSFTTVSDVALVEIVQVRNSSALYTELLMGSAFPAASIAKEERCLWDVKRRLAICGDFCVSPNVEGAILSGLDAASKLTEILSCL